MPAGKQIVGLILFTYLCSIKNPSLVKLIDDEHLQFKWANPKEAAKLLKLKFSKELSEKQLIAVAVAGLGLSQLNKFIPEKKIIEHLLGLG